MVGADHSDPRNRRGEVCVRRCLDQEHWTRVVEQGGKPRRTGRGLEVDVGHAMPHQRVAVPEVVAHTQSGLQVREMLAGAVHTDVDRGNATLDMKPAEAQRHIAAARRTPLTIEEGLALLLQYPEFLQPNRCFMSLGSRGGDKRVPAFWLSGGQPKLGWCWEGNPHSWLGFASCAGRSEGVELGQLGGSE